MLSSSQQEHIIMENVSETFRPIAIQLHGDQRYGQFPYAIHLADVESVLVSYGFTERHYRIAAWLHDVLEDTDTTAQYIKDTFGFEIAMIVLACTGVGSNRAEKQANILEKLQAYPDAVFVKVADRISNLCAGLYENNHKKLAKYITEHENFYPIVRELIYSCGEPRGKFLLEKYLVQYETAKELVGAN